MTMTEEEAKTKWCPFARVLVDRQSDDENITAANRLEVVGSSEPDLEWVTPRCIASECMAWRVWGYEYLQGTGCDDVGKRRPTEEVLKDRGRKKHLNADYDPLEPKYFKPLGFCGLAGKP